jgi:hypothetical protein
MKKMQRRRHWILHLSKLVLWNIAGYSYPKSGLLTDSWVASSLYGDFWSRQAPW